MKLVIHLALALGLSAGSAAAAETQLLFHAGVHGEIDDCGCKRNPLGGVAQRAAHIQTARAEGDVILVDAGNLFGKATEEQRAQTEFLIAETSQLGYVAQGVGPWDLNYGVEFLREAGQKLPFTSANVTVDGKLLFDPYKITEHDGVTFGWVSVMDPDHQLSSMADISRVKVLPVVETLARVLPEVHEKADVVVLLSNLRQGELKRKLEAHGAEWNLDYAIDGASSYHYATLKTVGDTTLLAANNRGKYLGKLHLTFGADGSVDEAYELISIKPRGQGPSDDAIAERVEDYLAQAKTVTAGSR